MNDLYDRFDEKNRSRKQSKEHNEYDDDDDYHHRDHDKENRSSKTITRKSNSARMSRTYTASDSQNLNMLLRNLLDSAFEDTRFKGKQLNCGRYKEKREDKRSKQKLNSSREPELKQQIREIQSKQMEEKLKTLPKFKCGKYMDKTGYPNKTLKEKKRPASTNDLRSRSLNDLSKLLENKTQLKPFTCGKYQTKEKIPHFSPAKTTDRKPEELLGVLTGKLRTTSRLVDALSLDKSKAISDKPMKFGKFKIDDRQLFSARSEANRKNRTKITNTQASIDIDKEALRKLESARKPKPAPMKFSKKLDAKPIPHFSSQKRLTLNELLNQSRRSANSSLLLSSKS